MSAKMSVMTVGVVVNGSTDPQGHRSVARGDRRRCLESAVKLW